MNKLNNIIKKYNSVLYEPIPLNRILTEATKAGTDLFYGAEPYLQYNQVAWVWLETHLVIPLTAVDFYTTEVISFITKDPLTEETQVFLTTHDIYNWTGYSSSFITADLDTYLKDWILIKQ